MGKPTGKRETRTIVVGPDGKRFAFPASMPREEMRDRMRAAYAEETRIAQEKVRRAGIDREATAAGQAEGRRAAERMGVDTPLEMAFAAPAIGMAQQFGARPVYDREGIMLPDEAAGLSALNSAGFFIPGMVNQRFGERLAEGRRQEPGFALAGEVAGGLIPGELIGQGIAQVGKMIAPQFARLGSMLKGKPEDAPLVLGPESRIRPIDRPDAFPGDDVLTARALDQWTPPPEQQVRPMGFDASRPRVAKRQTRQEPFFDERLTASENKAVEMRRNGYSTEEIADEMDIARNTVDQFLFKAKSKGVDIGAASRDLRRDDVLALKQKGLSNKQIEDRLGMKPDSAKVVLSQERARLKKLGEQVPDWLSPTSAPRGGGRPRKLGQGAGDAVEQTFGAAYMSGTGSVAGGQYDLNGDGQIDNADLAIGSGIGLAAFASPLALRKIAELGGRLKGTKPPVDGDDINPAGFTGPGGYSMKSAVETPEEDIVKWANENVTVKPGDGRTTLKIKSSDVTESGDPRKLNDVTINIDRAYAPNVREPSPWAPGKTNAAEGVYVDMTLSGRFQKDGKSSASDVAKASRVFSKAIGALRAYAAKEKPKFITFSGASPDHEKLYSYLLENYKFPGYKFYVQTESGAMKAIDDSGARAVWAPNPKTKFYLVREDVEGTIDPARLSQRAEVIDSSGRPMQVVNKRFEGLEPGGRQ